MVKIVSRPMRGSTEYSTVVNRLSTTVVAGVVLAVGILSLFVVPNQAQAIPAFARKYNVNCTVCHTAPPVLNPFGQRFLENGYQLPGTEDGGINGKKRLGDVTLDDVTNYLSFRMVGNVVRNWSFAKQNPPGADPGAAVNKTEFTFPDYVTLFTAGTLTKNIGFMVALDHDVEEGETGVERAFVTFNNLGSYNLAHLRVGKFDPSAFYSLVTIRQQLGEIGESASSTCSVFAPCTLNRPGLVPVAFATKFHGLYQRDGTAISPYAASLFNSPGEMGIDVHGRPFGDWFLYQVGILNGANEGFGDSNKGKDVYGMVRFDYARSNNFSVNVSGFVYIGNSNAKVLSQDDVNWNRYGVSARATYKMFDLYAAFAIDKINKVPAAVASKFDPTATGLTIGADAYITNNALVSVRYDNLDAGGMLDQRKSSTFVGVQAKYFLRMNIAIFVRDDFNIRATEGGDSAARNLRNAFFSGIDMAF